MLRFQPPNQLRAFQIEAERQRRTDLPPVQKSVVNRSPLTAKCALFSTQRQQNKAASDILQPTTGSVPY